MPAKEVVARLKLFFPAGQAIPGPRIAPIFKLHGLNPQDFCLRFNKATKEQPPGIPLPVVITIYKDHTFDFVVKNPPTSVLLKQAARIAQGSASSKTQKVATLSKRQIEEIARIKLKEMNTLDLQKAIKMVEGSAKNMGIVIKEE